MDSRRLVVDSGTWGQRDRAGSWDWQAGGLGVRGEGGGPLLEGETDCA